MNLDFCPNKASKEFKEMSSVFGEDKAYFLWMRNNGNHLEKAPNGANSKLFDDFLKHFNGDRKEALRAKAKIYRNEFINWFGDWINDSVNASKVVDENSEPLIVWHGSKTSNEITVFHDGPTYFADMFTASSYTPSSFVAKDETDYMYPSFLNIRSPKLVNGNGSYWNDIDGMSTDDIVKSIDKNEDGVIIKDIKDYSEFTPGNPDLSLDLLEEAPLHTDYVTTSPNQIKSATDNNGLFSKTNDNIRDRHPYVVPNISLKEVQSEEAIMLYISTDDSNIIKGELGVNKQQLISLLGSTMYKQNVQTTAVKELLQNAFDAVKIAKALHRIQNANIDVIIDSEQRTITIKDNGIGMSPEIVQKAFFTIGGSYKGENVDNRLKSGGLGLAKMAFLFSSDYVEVTTVKDGTKTYVKTTPNEIQNDNFVIRTSKTSEQNGTEVTVKIPEFYYTENGDKKSIWFDSSPDFLEKPMIGDVTVNIINKRSYGDRKSSEYKGKIPEGYYYLGKATSAFGDVEIYVAPSGPSYYTESEILISGLYLFRKSIYSQNKDSRLNAIINILPSVGVRDPIYPINNQREGFRTTVEPEVEDLMYLLNKINQSLARKSVLQMFNNTVSIDVKEVSDVTRERPKKNIFQDVVSEILKKYASQTLPSRSNPEDIIKGVKLIWKQIQEDKLQDKTRKSSLDTSGIKIDQSQYAVDTSHLDVTKPLFHNNTTMVLEEDAQSVLLQIGQLLMELKQLYIQTYENLPIETRHGLNSADFIKTQYWGFSFDKGYGGVNVNPLVFNLLAINPFYTIPTMSNVDTALAITEYITHLIIHEFNHNYAAGEGALFTGRFPLTYAEFAGIGRQFNKDWKNKLYRIIKDNLNVFVKYEAKYKQSSNRGESLLSDRLQYDGKEETVKGEKGSFKSDVQNGEYSRSEENVLGYGLESNSIFDSVNNSTLKVRKKKKYQSPQTNVGEFTMSEDLMASTPTQQQMDDEYNKISEKIRDLFQTLYKKFDKMPNKSTTRRNTQTNIFKTISELKSQLADLAITTALRSAIEQLGLMDDQDASPQSLNTLYAWFVNQEGKLIPYENVTPEQLQDIYKHLIGFYRSMLALIPNRESTLLNENQRQLRSAVESQLNVIENMWKHAVELIGEREIDKMIDKFTGLAIPQEQKENMKKVYRDWLHKNWFYGDITSFTSLFTSYGQSSNPIVRIAFHLTQYAEQKTQEELLEEAVPLARQFQKVSTLSSWVKPGWLKIFQEKNRDGVPTGYWVRPINYGQYELDKNEFVLKLNDEFDNKYGFHYIDDDLGMVKNSVTGVYIEDDANEQWNGNTPPPYIEYMLKLIKWKCDHANMRYTYEYYSERLSRPYDPVHYPQGHGLSLKALNAYNAVQSRINYYLDLCRDKDGVSRPELPKDMGGLTDAERQELDKAKLDLEELSSPFEENGTVKVDDDYQIAMEILTWQNFINNEVDNDNIDYSQFKLAEDEAIRLSNEKNDPSILVNFYRYNTVTKIDPSFIKAIFGVSRNLSSADIIVKQILTKCMENLTKIKDNVYTRDIEPFVNNTQFWVSYQKMVQDAKDGAVYDRIEDPTLDLNDVASYYNIVYKDGNGVMYDIWGNPATSSTPSNHLMTWYGFIINKYKEIADNNNGIIPGVEDEYGNPIIFSGTDAQVYDAIKNKLFSYEATWFDKKGMMHSEIKPLPIFLILIPNDRSLITRVPVGKWSIKDSRFTNHNFDNNQGISEQPRKSDNNGNSLYDNSEAYRKVTENKEVYKLYNMMIDSMKRMQKVMGFSNRTFNYQMPMLNADTSALLSRGDLNSLLYSVLNIQNDDTDMRNIKEGIRNADGTVSFDIPLRLLQKLDNMKMLSSDVIQSVILYAQMAYNYRNKKAILDTMLTIHDNLTPSVRKRTLTDAERFGSTPIDQSPAIDDSESLKQYEAMMDSTMYGMDTGASLKVHKEASKAQVAGRKFGSSAIRTEAVATLGLNILSMFAGGFDSMAKQLRESIMNRYMSFADLAKSYIYCLTNLPIVLANVGNPIPNCKIIAMMLLNSLSKNYTAIFDNMNHNRLVKLSNNLLMGGFSMFDYFANMVLLRAHYRNVRFYDGNVIPKGFYTAYEMRQAFKQAGKSWKEGALAHSLCKTSLWSAYEFRDGRAVVKDEWKNYVTDTVKTNIRTKSLQRSALYNGMAPDNDRARYLKTVWGKIIAAMRNWFLMVQQRNWVGSDDTSVLEVTDLVTKNISFGKTKIKTSKRVSQRTDEQSSQRMGWNFETNAPQEEIVKATIRALWKTLRIGWNAFTLKFSQVKNIKLSQVERYAVRGFIMNLAMIAMLASVFIPIMNRAKQVVMPSNREEAGVTHTILNINNGDLISLWSADATIRAFESAYAEMDPMEVKNMVKSVSALMGAVDNQTSLVQAVPEALGYSDHTLEEMISSAGKYKYYTRGERYAYKAVGPVNNIITAFTIQGAKYNLQYYTNNYGDFFRVYGYDFKSQKKDKKSNSGIQRPKIERPTIQRPLIQRPKILRP